jgi:hypothetical protein
MGFKTSERVIAPPMAPMSWIDPGARVRIANPLFQRMYLYSDTPAKYSSVVISGIKSPQFAEEEHGDAEK